MIQETILFVGTLAGGITDYKTGYIFDWITYPMILLGVITSLFFGRHFNLLSGATIFAMLFLLYYFGKIGGGDVKLFTGIALLNPFNSIDFLLTVFFIAAMSSMTFYSVYYSIKYYRKGIKWEREKNGLQNALLIGFILVAYFVIMGSYGLISTGFLVLIGVPFIVGLLYFGLQEGIKREFFEKKVLLKELEEDEIIGSNNSKKVFGIMRKKQLVGEKELKKMEKEKIKSISVLRNLPKFGPFIFVGVVIGLLQPELVLIIF